METEMRYTIIVTWNRAANDAMTLRKALTWQEVINYIVDIGASAMQETIRSIVIQPDHVVSEDKRKVRFITAEQLKAA